MDAKKSTATLTINLFIFRDEKVLLRAAQDFNQLSFLMGKIEINTPGLHALQLVIYSDLLSLQLKKTQIINTQLASLLKHSISKQLAICILDPQNAPTHSTLQNLLQIYKMIDSLSEAVAVFTETIINPFIAKVLF